jgi:hypothetical protein
MMKKKNNKSINRRLHQKLIKILITLLLSFYFYTQFSFSTDYITVWPYEIKFDYEDGYTNDAVNIRKDFDEDIPIPEWKYNGGQEISEKFAYIKGQSNRKIQVRFNSNCESMHLLINLNVISGNGFGEICNFFVVNYEKLEWITLTLNGTIPNSIGIRKFVWEWEIYAIPNDPDYCSAMSNNETDHGYYTLLVAPQDPMSEPWSCVLDYACDWASGQSTNSSVLNALTTDLYTSGLIYDGEQSHYHFDQLPYPTKVIFDLSDFLNDWFKADCQDCAMFLSILSSSIGASLTQTRRIEGPFYLEEILSIGRPFWNWTEQGEVEWVFHHIGWLNNVYDPSVLLKRSSPYIPIDINIDNPYKTDLHYSGDWIPKNPFRLGQTDPYFYLPTEIQ